MSPYEPQQPYAPAAPPEARVGFLDLGFKRFLTLRLVSVLWAVALVLIVLSTVTGVIVGIFFMGTDDQGAVVGVLTILGSLVGAVFAALFARIALESVAVLFRIADNTSVMARRP